MGTQIDVPELIDRARDARERRRRAEREEAELVAGLRTLAASGLLERQEAATVGQLYRHLPPDQRDRLGRDGA